MYLCSEKGSVCADPLLLIVSALDSLSEFVRRDVIAVLFLSIE